MKLSSAIRSTILASFCAMEAFSEDAPVVNPPCAIWYDTIHEWHDLSTDNDSHHIILASFSGCSFCPDGFVVGNPGGTIPVPPEFADQAPPGLTEVPCSLLDFAGTSGQIPEELCNDDLRLLPEFRQIWCVGFAAEGS